MKEVNVKVGDGEVQVTTINVQPNGKGFGRCYKFQAINDETLAMPDLRDVPARVKDAIVSETQYVSFYNGERPTPSQLNPDVDMIA